MYGGGRMAERRISVGESSEEWLMAGSAVGTVEVMNWEWKYRRVGGIVGVFEVDWGC